MNAIRLPLLLLVAVGSTWVCSDQTRANFVTNGSFEAVQIGSPFLSTSPADIPGWTHTGSVGDALILAVGYSDGGGNVTTAGDGRQFVTLGGGFFGTGTGFWSQTLTGLTVGSTYSLSFQMASEGTFSGSQSITVDYTSGSSTAAQSFSAVASPANYWRIWETKTTSFVATASSVGLRFGASTQYDVGLDNVIVNLAAPAVPEPSTLLMTASGGLIGLGVFRNRRRSKAA